MQEEQMQPEENGVTFGDIFRMIKKRLWIVLLSCAVFTVACVLLLAFLINPGMTTYTMSFRILFPTSDSAVYPDGSPFVFQDIVTEEYLNETKALGEEFSSINVSRMLKNNAASVSIARTEEGLTEAEGPYTLQFEGSYFDNDDQADNFLHALARLTCSKLKARATEVSYQIDLEDFRNAPFPERLLLLEQQRSTLLMQYDFWIENYSEAYSVKLADGKATLGGLRAKVTTLFGQNTLGELREEIESKGYAYAEDFAEYQASLIDEYKLNEIEETEIRDAMSENSDLPDRLLELIARNSRIKRWLDLQTNYTVGSSPTLTKINNDAFAKRLEDEYDKLQVASETLTAAISSIYDQGTQVIFEEQTVQRAGGISLILGGGVALVGSALVACIVVYCVERSKQRAAEGQRAAEQKE